MTQEGGPVTLFIALPLHPTPKHGAYPLAAPYLAQMHGCSQKCLGDANAHSQLQRKREAWNMVEHLLQC